MQVDEVGIRSVCISVFFPKVQIYPARELPAENHVQHEQGVVVRRAARGCHVPDAQLRLRRVRTMVRVTRRGCMGADLK